MMKKENTTMEPSLLLESEASHIPSGSNLNETPRNIPEKCEEQQVPILSNGHDVPSTLTITVKSIYTKKPKPGIHKLPLGWKPKDLTCKEQFMSRRRVRTKPMNYNNKPHPNNYEIAMFKPDVGIDPFFWHNDQKMPKVEGGGTLYGCRAILFQCVEHYENLGNNPKFADKFKDVNCLESPTFGEQVIVHGCDAKTLAVGDMFAVEGGPDVSPLVIEITCPRKPCHMLNKSNGTSLGNKGLSRHCLSIGCAGWFTRVLVAGELRDGMKLIRIKHPHPKWTLWYISRSLFGEATMLNHSMCKAQWNGSQEELRELVNIPELSTYEWKDDALALLQKIEKMNQHTKVTEGERMMTCSKLKKTIFDFIGGIQIMLLAYNKFDFVVMIVVLAYFVYFGSKTVNAVKEFLGITTSQSTD